MEAADSEEVDICTNKVPNKYVFLYLIPYNHMFYFHVYYNSIFSWSKDSQAESDGESNMNITMSVSEFSAAELSTKAVSER